MSYALRAYTWHQYRVHVEVQALQVSLLAGRVFFKDLRYHGTNETIIIHGGHVTWRYWLRKVKEVDCIATTEGAGTQRFVTKDNGAEANTSTNVSDGERGGVAKSLEGLPCRIAVSARGLEWFVYNRTPAYDAIVASVSSDDKRMGNPSENLNGTRATRNTVPRERPSGPRRACDQSVNAQVQINEESTYLPAEEKIHPSIALDGGVSSKSESVTKPVDAPSFTANDAHAQSSGPSQQNSAPASNILKVLPVYIECNKGAIVLGNENTRTILTTKFDHASGHVDATHSRPVDQYKQLFNFDFKRPLIQMRPNLDFHHSQLSAAARSNGTKHRDTGAKQKRRDRRHNTHHNHGIWQTLLKWTPYFRVFHRSKTPAQNTGDNNARLVSQSSERVEDRWLGLSRYIKEDEQIEKQGWESIEYAKVSTVLDCPSLGMSFYWDVPGLVPGPPYNGSVFSHQHRNDINGDAPPEWGIDLRVRGGSIHYGPWTDRERADLQAMFFPNSYKDAVPAAVIAAGHPRVSTVFKLRIDLEESVIFRIPFREESKDWKWTGRADAVRRVETQQRQKEKRRWGIGKKGNKGASGPDTRPFGWVDAKIERDSTISYTMDMFASPRGFENRLEIDLRAIEMSSSVNHGLMWRSAHQTILCDLSNPLEWNALHAWKFDVVSDGLELFLLRDHIFLLTDLINDWTSGPPADYYTFIPFRYGAKFRFPDFKLYLNANDSNIINDPSNVDDNTFIMVWGAELTAAISIPSTSYRPLQNVISFDVSARDGGFELRTPVWNTQNTFLENKNIASMTRLAITGSYDYYTSVAANLTDTLILDLHGAKPSIHLYGFFVRYLMRLKENYFGDDLHFRTLEEFQRLLIDQASRNKSNELDLESRQGKKSNDLDVILSVTTDDVSALLPAHLYSAKESVMLNITSVMVDLRFTSYYMDLEVNFSPVSMSLKSADSGVGPATGATSSTQVFVDGLNIYGHRLFGLPPAEPTYVCNWDFNVGAIRGQFSSDFLRALLLALQSFVFSFDDSENALPSIHEKGIHDVTFLRAKMEPIQLWLVIEGAAILISTDAVSMNFNDWASKSCSERLDLAIPALTVACVNTESLLRHKGKLHPPLTTLAYLQTSVNIALVQKNNNSRRSLELQQHHLHVHDLRTKRTPWLLHGEKEPIAPLLSGTQPEIDVPAMPFPPMPEPTTVREEALNRLEALSSGSAASRSPVQSTGRKSSFLSSVSSNRKSKSDGRRSSTHSSQSSRSGKHRTTYSSSMSEPSARSTRWALSSGVNTAESGYTGHPLVKDDEPRTSAVSSSRTSLPSGYATPLFPFSKIELDLQGIPEMPDNTSCYYDFVQSTPLSAYQSLQGENDYDHQTSFIVTLDSGVKAYCSPEALFTISRLISHMQPKDPVSVLDRLQMDVMDKISTDIKQNLKLDKTTEITVRVPYAHIRFVNASNFASNLDPDEEQDQYNLILSRCAVTARSEVKAPMEDKRADAEHMSTLHLSVESVSFFVEERANRTSNQCAAAHIDISDVVLWVSSRQSVSANLRLKQLNVVTLSRKIDYLASLIQRSSVITTSLTSAFETPVQQQKMGLRHLVFALTMLGGSVPDPPFLTRSSDVLRSATGHVRINDSWKIISRFRYIWQSLAEHQKGELHSQCATSVGQCPSDAVSVVSESFDRRWRSWEITQVRKSYVLQKVFGVIDAVTDPNVRKPFSASAAVNVGIVRVVLDSGPNQNELSVGPLVIRTAFNLPAAASSTGSTLDSLAERTTVVQVHCGSIAVDLHWELWELFEDVYGLYQARGAHKPVSSVSTLPPKTFLSKGQQYHIILSAERGKIILDCINAKLVAQCDKLGCSAVNVEYPDVRKRCIANFLLHADASSVQILGRTKTLALSELRHPMICASRIKQPAGDTISATWKLAGSCRKLQCQVRENLLGVIRVIDLLINDELAYVRRVMIDIRGQPDLATPVVASPTWKPIPQVVVALSIDEYQLKLALLDSLTYEILGEVSRVSVLPRPNGKAVVDFDFKSQSHTLGTDSDGRSEKVSVLEVPAINGRVSIPLSDTQTFIKVFVAVEPITLDAGALHSLLDILNRSHISDLVLSIREDFVSLTNRLEQTSEPKPKLPPTGSVNSSQRVAYNVHISIAEVGIHAIAPGVSSDEAAHMNLRFDYMQLRASNRSGQGLGVLENPEIYFHLQEVLLKLKKTEGTSTRMCGSVCFELSLDCTAEHTKDGDSMRAYQVKSHNLRAILRPDTASTIVDIAGCLQDKVKGLELPPELKHPQRLRYPKSRLAVEGMDEGPDSGRLFKSMYSLTLLDIQISWVVGPESIDSPNRQAEDLVLSITNIDLATRKENAARLMIQGFQLQMVPAQHNKRDRSLNSALLPEVVFNVAYLSTRNDRRLAFQAAGKSLDLRLTSQFILPASTLQRSVALASHQVRIAAARWTMMPTASSVERKTLLGNKRLASLLIDADFAGAVVYIQGRRVMDPQSSALNAVHGGRLPQHGRYGQFTHEDESSSTTLRAPGIALKVEYNDNGNDDPSLNAEVKVDASSNKIYPTVVPLVMEISSSIKAVVGEPKNDGIKSNPKPPQKIIDEGTLRTANPTAVLGKCKLNIGLQIRRQEFSLSCQPIARVAAIARFEDIYITVNTVQSIEHSRFFAVSATFSKLQASLQHVYSRESTGSFDVESVVVSLMNSRHVSDANGLSVILKISPMAAQFNAKQLQDYLLFREIWMPADIRQSPSTSTPPPTSEPQAYTVQRYQHVAAAGAFPWNATVFITELSIQLDMGQALGKSAFTMSNFWISTKKTSDWEQNLCLGIRKFAVHSTGRMSGFLELQSCKVRTSIQWPLREKAVNQTPLIQASLGFDELRVKAAFDYQAFLVADITSLKFLMYNVRNTNGANNDRLVGSVDGDKLQVFCTSTGASQGFALYQAFQRLAQEKQTAYESSLKDIERFLRRKSTITATGTPPSIGQPAKSRKASNETPILLHTDVMVTLRAVNIGAFPSTFFDNQIFKFEALDAEARFAVVLENDKVHSGLGLTLGQLRIALSGVRKPNLPKSLGEVAVEDVISRATGSRGGTILKVPKVVANMETWQIPGSNHIDYKFTSSFEGKVDVGWNYSRISFIRGMWASHSRSLAQRLGKPLPQSAVQITGGPRPDVDGERQPTEGAEQEKITAVVNVPQSRYNYTALEAPVIETPQLRDMGEATPPLEWIGLQRDRLPHLTHQLIIVTLLEVAKEVEDAYSKILGST